MGNRKVILVGIASQGANYNADFTGSIRKTIGDVIHATPSALKYPTKKFMEQQGHNVLGLENRAYIKDGHKVLTLNETVTKRMKDKDTKINENNVIDEIMSASDIKQYGLVLTKPFTRGFTGAVQVTQGINTYKESEIINQTIKSPYASEEGKSATTIGSRTIVDFALYNHIVKVNMSEYDKLAEETGLDIKYKESDYQLLLNSLKYGVTNHSTASKVGCNVSYVLEIDIPDTALGVINGNLQNFVKVDLIEEDNYTFVSLDFSKVTEYLNKQKEIGNVGETTLYADTILQKVNGWNDRIEEL